MGLAPYGEPIYKEIILDNLIDVKEDGSFHLDQSYFNYATGLTMTNKKFNNLFGKSPRVPEKEDLTQFHMNIAASIQSVIEEIMIKIAKYIRYEYDIKYLCLAGGVALNCVANGKILEENIFDKIWVQPAAGDAGGSLGAALALWYEDDKNHRKINFPDSMKGSYLGPEFNDQEIKEELTKAGAKFEVLNESDLIQRVANDLSKDNAIGWFQGRMEFGPRALGSRSILGNPKSSNTQKNLNLKVKYRESFRPFAPSIIKEDVSEWFDLKHDSPYMLFVSKVNKNKIIPMKYEEEKLFGIDKLNIKRSEIPAVTHIDYSARIQTVEQKINSKYFKLLNKFKEITGCPVLVNTSFNIRGEPIVNTPTEAFSCFMGTNLDKLAIGNCYLNKDDQNKNLLKNYSQNFQLD